MMSKGEIQQHIKVLKPAFLGMVVWEKGGKDSNLGTKFRLSILKRHSVSKDT